MICPLCSHRFESHDVVCAPACPLSRVCKVLCCPRCHYQFVEHSSVVNWFRRIAGRLQRLAEAAR